jgi:hypothetical protein
MQDGQNNLWWYSDEKGPMSGKVDRAATHYAARFGQVAEVCYVHPTDMAALVTEIEAAQSGGEDGQAVEPAAEVNEIIVGGVRVRPQKYVLPYHFCVGLEPKKAGKDDGNGHRAGSKAKDDEEAE